MTDEVVTTQRYHLNDYSNSASLLNRDAAIDYLRSIVSSEVYTHFQLIFETPILKSTPNCNSEFTFLGDTDGSPARLLLFLLSNNIIELSSSDLDKLATLITAEQKICHEVNISYFQPSFSEYFTKYQQNLDFQNLFIDIVSTCHIVDTDKVIIVLGDNIYDRLSLSITAMLMLLEKMKKNVKNFFIMIGNHDIVSQANSISNISSYQFGSNDDGFKESKTQVSNKVKEFFNPILLIDKVLISHHGILFDEYTNQVLTAFGNIELPDDFELIENKPQWLVNQIEALVKAISFDQPEFARIDRYGKLTVIILAQNDSLLLSNFNKSNNKQLLKALNAKFKVDQLHGHTGSPGVEESEGFHIFNANSRIWIDSEKNILPYSAKLAPFNNYK